MLGDLNLAKNFGVCFPIVQALMAGGATMTERVVAVFSSAGLGSLEARYSTPAEISP